jgi:hypothetical protein
MVVGDKKQAAILGAVALVIISAGVFEFIPKGSAPPMAEAIRATDVAAATHQKQIDEELPSAITSSPFAAPKAINGTTSAGSDSDNSSNVAGAKGNAPNASRMHRGGGSHAPMRPGITGHSFGEIPNGSDMGSGETPGGLTPEGASTGGLPVVGPPGENTGLNQQQIKEHTRTATLDAVIKYERWTAIISVSGREEPMELEVGRSFGGYRILSIDESGITLLIGKTLETVSVGSSVSL